MSDVLVTGGAGYIGSILVPALLSRGNRVTVIDNFMYNQPSLLDVCGDKGLTIVRGDVRDDDLIGHYVPQSEFIIPLACIVGAPACKRDPQRAESINFGAIGTILKYRRNDQKIIYPNTNSGYGIGQSGVYCNEESPLKPLTLYGQTKVRAEQSILESGNSITLRLATVFGISPRMRLDLLVNDFVYRAVTDRFIVLFESHFKRNYIHVRDVAGAFIHAMDNFENMRGEAYNVGLSDANLSKYELCVEIKKQLPDFSISEDNIGEDPDKRDYIVSNEKIEATGFRPGVSLREGISELIKGYQIIRRNEFSNL